MKRKNSPDRAEASSSRVQEPAVVYSVRPDSNEGFLALEEIRKGFPFGKFLALQKQLEISLLDLADLVGVAHRTLHRRREDGTFSKDESDRIARLQRLAIRAAEVLGGIEPARQWLRRPQIALGGMVPLDIADTGPGVVEVERLLGQIEYGVYA